MTEPGEPEFDREGLVAAILAKQMRLDWTQCAVAEKTGVSKGAMSRLLNGDLSPGLATVIKLTDWLEVPFDRFVRRPNQGSKGNREDTVAKIEALVFFDESLHVSDAAALVRIVDVSYRALQRRSNERPTCPR